MAFNWLRDSIAALAFRYFSAKREHPYERNVEPAYELNAHKLKARFVTGLCLVIFFNRFMKMELQLPGTCVIHTLCIMIFTTSKYERIDRSREYKYYNAIYQKNSLHESTKMIGFCSYTQYFYEKMCCCCLVGCKKSAFILKPQTTELCDWQEPQL